MVYRVHNVARLALADELLAVLKAAGLALHPQDLRLSYDEHMRPTHWFVRLPFVQGTDARVREANAVLQGNVFGGRVLRLERRVLWHSLPPVPSCLAGYTQRAVCVSGMSEGTTSHDVEQFFGDFSLAADPVHLMRRHGADTSTGCNQLAVVRFTDALEAHRAVREKHRELLNTAQVAVQLLQ